MLKKNLLNNETGSGKTAVSNGVGYKTGLCCRLIAALNYAFWIAVFGIVNAPLLAHIVPSETYHPVTESYRRMSFVLNLNPVPWELVKSDIENLTAGFEEFDAERTAQIKDSFREALAELGEEMGPEERKRIARNIFEISTPAVADLLIEQLERSNNSLNDYRAAQASLDSARQLWASFHHEVRYTDPPGFKKIGMAWLELSTSLGSPGFLNDRAVPPEPERFLTNMSIIRDYVAANYCGEFQVPQDSRLEPLPRASVTYDGSRTIPTKLPPGSEINKQLPRPRQILNMAERGVDEGETVLIALGDMAFDSPFILGHPARSLLISCNTCHNKSITNPKFSIPGLSTRAGGLDVSNSFFASHANNGHFDPLDIPDLRGIRFTAPYGRNGRFDSLREFVRNVIVNEFNGSEPDPVLMDGIIAYMLEFDFLANPNLNLDGSLTDLASEEARRGEELFHRPYRGMNGRSCATCHVPSANFVDHKRHDLGTMMRSSTFSRDGSLDTPTLLGIKYSAPYFHDGRLPTIQAVSVWFNENFDLGLTERELGDLTTYVETVGSGVAAYEDTLQTLESELEEFSFFLSAYEFLKQNGKWELIDITLQTITHEIHAHKWDLQDPQYMSILNLMAETTEDASEAIAIDNFETVDVLVAEYRALYAEYADRLY
jgi:cytochrome c peroxidase